MAPSRARLLLRFFALGALLLAGSRWLASAGGAEEIVIGPGELAAARAEGLALLGREPAGGELDALVEARVRDEILYREALARGLDREDAGVRRRLVRNLAFLRGGGPAAGAGGAQAEDALYREALALGMNRSDTVVRRLLVQRVKLEVEAEARAAEPTEAELRSWLAAHPREGRAPRRASFRHLFFDPARRGSAAEADARAAAAALVAGGPVAGGDPCLAAREQPLQSEALVARMLGPGFAAALFAAPADAWSGPLRSSLGWHAVRVEAREEGAPLPFEALRGGARDALLAERAAAALERFLAERRPRYTIRIAAAAEPPR